MDGLCAGKTSALSSRSNDGLEPNSHPLGETRHLPAHHPSVRAVESGRLSHPPGERLPRHRHDVGFAAVVLAGGYVEAGDTGRHRVAAGDVILHRAFESHLDQFDRRGAQVLVLPMPARVAGVTRGRFGDPDLLARLAANDAYEASQVLGEGFQVAAPSDEIGADEDWPDTLARRLLTDPDLPIAAWARATGLHPGSVSRAFQQQFGVTAARFRATARAHRALAALDDPDLSLAQMAGDCGFADQAHMTRAIVALTGSTPHRLRRAALELPS